MEIDRILYIFGSFTRKKQDKRKSLEPSSISAGNSPLHVQARRHVSQNLNIAPRTSAYEDSRRKNQLKEWNCGICKKELVEPRLLACLHSFCTRCLQGLHQEGEAEVWSEIDGGLMQMEPAESGSGSGAGSAGSGYESDLRNSGSDGSWDHSPRKYGILTRKISGKSVQILICPSCGDETQLPLGGISALPLNYVLLRKMAATQDEGIGVLCDLCNSDNKAESRCVQCLVSVCPPCGAAHGRQRPTARHSLLPLQPSTPKYCTQHPTAELNVYCATCQQVVCRDCALVLHAGHARGGAARAAGERARRVRDACARAALVPDRVQHAARTLHALAYEQDAQAAQVECEVRAWAERYSRAAAAHARALVAAAARARARGRQQADLHQRHLDRLAHHALHAVNFAEELVSGGREEEVLSLGGAVLRRLEQVSALPEPPPRAPLRFAPLAPHAQDPALVGRLLTAPPDPDTCRLTTGGFNDLRVDCQHEVVLELRDSSGERIWCGGEQVAGYFRRRDSSARPMSASVRDRNDGTYSITFTPSTPGAYLFAVTLNNKPIKGSPWACSARAGGAHRGTFHCCARCSGGGGGYKGCGHGHAGWPGTRHWSCCGATQRGAPCSAPPPPAPPPSPPPPLYQFSL